MNKPTLLPDDCAGSQLAEFSNCDIIVSERRGMRDLISLKIHLIAVYT